MEYKLYKSSQKGIRLSLLGAFAAIVSIGLTYTDPDNIIIYWLFATISILGSLVGIFVIFDRRPQIIVNEIGIFDRTICIDFINWEIIHDAYIVKVKHVTFICLVVKDNVDLSAKVNITLKKVSKALGFQEFNINLGMINVDEEKFIEFILAMRYANPIQRVELLTQMTPN